MPILQRKALHCLVFWYEVSEVHILSLFNLFLQLLLELGEPFVVFSSNKLVNQNDIINSQV